MHRKPPGINSKLLAIEILLVQMAVAGAYWLSLAASGVIRFVISGVACLVAGAVLYLIFSRSAGGMAMERDGAVGRQARQLEEMKRQTGAFLKERAQLIPVFVNQLQETIEQTEKAALGIGEGFMNIVGRARSQTGKEAGRVIMWRSRMARWSAVIAPQWMCSFAPRRATPAETRLASS